MGEEAITSGRQKALREAMILLDLAITRSRGSLLNAELIPFRFIDGIMGTCQRYSTPR
jgi:hypothetical protein